MFFLQASKFYQT